MGTSLSISRRRDETSCTELNTPLEPAPLDFAYRASEGTNKFEPTSGLRGEMDEFRRLKAIYPNASSRELAGFVFFAKAVAGYREVGRGSEDSGREYEDSGDDQRRRRQLSQELQGLPRAPPPCPTFRGTQVE